MKFPSFLAVMTPLAIKAYAAPTVVIGNTTLVGRDVTGLKQDFFGGIPYAEPPLGNLRLKPPNLKLTLDSATFDASNFGPGCLQPGFKMPSVSEDCLTINVFRPSNPKPGVKLPVLFWTYGGGFQSGASFMFNGSLIVDRSVMRGTPVIYVNFNYRLGPLGYPQGREAQEKGVLNLAIKDQIAAIKWVRSNIGAFGGDSDKVTLFGESAGAIMSAILYLNFPLHKFAQGVILESGSQATSGNFPPARREVNWKLFVTGVPSCAPTASSDHTIRCLRNANSNEIFAGLLSAIANSPDVFAFDPAIDGPDGLYPEIPSKLFARGQFERVPFIAGTNLDEGTFFVPTTVSSAEQIRESIIANYSPPMTQSYKLITAADKLLELYPDNPALGSPFNTGNDTFGLSSSFKQGAAIIGDLWFHSQRRFWQQAATDFGVKSWGYHFTQPQPQNPPFLGTTHTSEIPYVYGAPPDQSPSSILLSEMMMDYWISFATSLDPNDGMGTERPMWERYTPRNQRLLQLNGNDMKMIDDTYRKRQIDFINSDPLIFLH